MPDQKTGTLWLSCAALQENDLANISDGTRMRDAVVVRQGNAHEYRFPYATVVFESHAYDSVADAVSKIEAFEADDRKIDGKPVAHRTIALRPDGSPEASETVTRILLCEADEGAVGKTEHDAVYENFLDFGEHSVAVSPAGIAIAGTVEDEQVQVYLYYVAQIAAAICRYAHNEGILSEVMDDIRAKAAGFDVEKLQEINISTSKAMLDISDELLDIPPRESFILNKLLEVANVSVYEERISRMLGIIQHYVQHRHALTAKMNSQRVEFILFILAVVGGISGLVAMFSHAKDVRAEDVATLLTGVAMIAIAVIVTAITSIWFYRKRHDIKALADEVMGS